VPLIVDFASLLNLYPEQVAQVSHRSLENVSLALLEQVLPLLFQLEHVRVAKLSDDVDENVVVGSIR